MKMGKIYKLTKLILFVLMGIAILVLNELIIKHNDILNFLVGGIIAIYGLEGIILPIATKKVKAEKIEMFGGGVDVLIAIIMIVLLKGNDEKLRIVCVLWSLWSIMREGEEIFDKGFVGIKNHPITSAVNIIESIVVIVFSVILIVAPDEDELLHHAHAHVILLGIELIIEVIWVYVGEFEARILKRMRRRHTMEIKAELEKKEDALEEQPQEIEQSK